MKTRVTRRVYTNCWFVICVSHIVFVVALTLIARVRVVVSHGLVVILHVVIVVANLEIGILHVFIANLVNVVAHGVIGFPYCGCDFTCFYRYTCLCCGFTCYIVVAHLVVVVALRVVFSHAVSVVLYFVFMV